MINLICNCADITSNPCPIHPNKIYILLNEINKGTTSSDYLLSTNDTLNFMHNYPPSTIVYTDIYGETHTIKIKKDSPSSEDLSF